ncbi:MAG: DUF2961 domain-containing protein [Kiritimatiellae bacterium]|nr:DUF2961 domain-containing protein [Kiritimatiellia bacterium]
MKINSVAIVCFLVCSLLYGEEQKLSYVDLVKRLTDLERLAELPMPGEKCSQCSSYDRASKYDATTDSYIGWSANGDGKGIIRMEGDVQVLAEMEGPGCIWRIWSAAVGKGHVKIYLDGASEPAVDLPFSAYFDGSSTPFTRSNLVHTVARGWNNYVPIPYQKSCKIVADKDWGNYYHFVYSTFPTGTQVPTFKRELTAEESSALDRADKILGSCGNDPAGKRTSERTAREKIVIKGGKTTKVLKLRGTRAITAIRMKLDTPPYPDDRNVLRELALRITWDKQNEPAVWTPLGDFFGTAPGVNKYTSLPLGLTADDTWYSFWYMPFKKGALVELVNDGKTNREVSIEITYAPLTKPIEKLGRFHAKWHRDALLPERKDREIDWTMLKTEGTGRFCGVMLHVWNPRGGWWGEGDEKFFVDGEKFPSTIGTGSEDYFGYAWCCPQLFQNAYHNQTISMGNKGHVSVNRWHISDNVPFQKSFEGDIEKYFPNKKPTLYACTTYWYLSTDGKDPYSSLPVDQRVGYCIGPDVHQVKGAIEGETMKVLCKTGGKTHQQDVSNYKGEWSDGCHLWWTEGKPGDKLDLALRINKAGKYKMAMQLTKARDYGIVQLYLDGQKLGDKIDLYNQEVVPSGQMDMGIHDLPAGEHKLTVEIVGANEKAVRAHMFGLDYVVLQE